MAKLVKSKPKIDFYSFSSQIYYDGKDFLIPSSYVNLGV